MTRRGIVDCCLETQNKSNWTSEGKAKFRPAYEKRYNDLNQSIRPSVELSSCNMLGITASKPAMLRMKVSAGQKVCKKYRRAMMKKLQTRELKKLRSVIPSLDKKEVSKVDVVKEAIRYIDVLQNALAGKLRQIPGTCFNQCLYSNIRSG